MPKMLMFLGAMFVLGIVAIDVAESSWCRLRGHTPGNLTWSVGFGHFNVGVPCRPK